MGCASCGRCTSRRIHCTLSDSMYRCSGHTVWGMHPVENTPQLWYTVPCQTRCTGVPGIQCGACTLWRIHLSYDTLYLVRLDAQVCRAYSVEHAPCGEYTSIMIHCTLSDSLYRCAGCTVWSMHPVEDEPHVGYTVPCQTRCPGRSRWPHPTLQTLRCSGCGWCRRQWRRR